MMTFIICLASTFTAFAPSNPYRDMTFNQIRAQEIREQMKERRIEKLLKTIRIIESNERYDARGGSGEYGAYQFMPATWDFYCYMFFGERLDITDPDNQDKVARAKIAQYVDKGYSNVDISAIWNSGKPYGWQTKIGINRYGAKYNVPAYVNRFAMIYDNVIAL